MGGRGERKEKEKKIESKSGGSEPLRRQLHQLLRHEGILPHAGEEQNQEQGRHSQRLQNPLASTWGREQCYCDI